ncbi:hypothetical protein HanRHA438_Chr01g0029081 [Helianthus annuus]|nr:hypothetical protein HanRHA438_Chr01g0029081 [Helianthus annuus]
MSGKRGFRKEREHLMPDVKGILAGFVLLKPEVLNEATIPPLGVRHVSEPPPPPPLEDYQKSLDHFNKYPTCKIRSYAYIRRRKE